MPTPTELLQEIKNLRAELDNRTADLETLAQQTADLAFLNALNAAANRGDPLEKIIAFIAERTRELFNGHGVIVYLADEGGKRLLIQNLVILPKLRHKIEAILKQPIPKLALNLTPNSPFSRAIREQKTILVTRKEEILQIEREYALSNMPNIPKPVLDRVLDLVAQTLKLKSVMIAPLINNGTVVGAIDISSAAEFTATDVQRFDALAAQLTGIIIRKQTNAALRHSETLYHSLVENIPQNIFRKDTDGRFTFVNGNYCRMVGKRAEEILGKTDFDLHPRELAEKYRRDDIFVMKSGKTLDVIERHQTHDNPASYVRVIKTPLHDSNGTVIGVQGIFEDITLQKENEERLELYAQRLNILREIDRAILAAASPIEIAQAVMKPLLRIIDARRASMVMLDESTRTGTILAATGDVNPQGLQPGDTFKISDYPAYHRYRDASERVMEAYLTSSNSPMAQKLEHSNIHAAINVPLLHGGELVGALNFGFSRPEDILPEYREIAREVGDSLAVALKQAQQTEKLREESAAKTRLLQEIDHRVRNNLAAIVGMIYLEMRQAEKTNTPVSQKTLEAINVRVRALAALHELLATHTWQPIPLRDVASRVFNAVYRAIDTASNEIIVDISATALMVPPQAAHSLTTIFTEVLFNLVEHALPKYHRLVLRISAEEDSEHITLTFCTEQSAFPDNLPRKLSPSAGITLFDATVKQSLHGEWHMENKDGSAAITIRFPKEIISPNT